MKTRVPHTYVLLIGLVILAALATWIIPAGSFDRVVEQGREVVDPRSFHPVEARPAGLSALFLAFPRGLVEIAEIVFYIFIIGGAFGVLDKTGVIHLAVGKLSMEADKIAENVKVLLDEIVRKKPADAKGDFIQSVFIAGTMTPGVKIIMAQTK